MAFEHERLRVHARATELVETVEELVRGVGPAHASLVDQIRRSASSIVLNIAEGASEYSRKEKMRFYRIARRSTAETHAALQLLKTVGAVTESRVRNAARIADDVSRMLAGLLRPTAGIGNASTRAPAPAPASAPAEPAPAVPAVPAPAPAPGNASASAPSSRTRRISP